MLWRDGICRSYCCCTVSHIDSKPGLHLHSQTVSLLKWCAYTQSAPDDLFLWIVCICFISLVSMLSFWCCIVLHDTSSLSWLFIPRFWHICSRGACSVEVIFSPILYDWISIVSEVCLSQLLYWLTIFCTDWIWLSVLCRMRLYTWFVSYCTFLLHCK